VVATPEAAVVAAVDVSGAFAVTAVDVLVPSEPHALTPRPAMARTIAILVERQFMVFSPSVGTARKRNRSIEA
jgi:hypothetical protein